MEGMREDHQLRHLKSSSDHLVRIGGCGSHYLTGCCHGNVLQCPLRRGGGGGVKQLVFSFVYCVRCSAWTDQLCGNGYPIEVAVQFLQFFVHHELDGSVRCA